MGTEPVPTLPELHKRGLAERVGDSHYRATAEGQAEIDGAMRRNAAWLREHPDEARAAETAGIHAARAAGGTEAAKKSRKKK